MNILILAMKFVGAFDCVSIIGGTSDQLSLVRNGGKAFPGGNRPPGSSNVENENGVSPRTPFRAECFAMAVNRDKGVAAISANGVTTVSASRTSKCTASLCTGGSSDNFCKGCQCGTIPGSGNALCVFLSYSERLSSF